MARNQYRYAFKEQSNSRFDGWRDWLSENRKWGWDRRGDDDAPSRPTGNNDSGDDDAPSSPTGNNGSSDNDTPSSPTGNNGSSDNDTPSSPAGNGSGSDGTTPAPSTGGDFAHQLLKLTNAYRAQNGVAPLQWDDQLAKAAQAHTQDMADKNYFSHTQPDGDTLSDRLNEVGYDYRGAGENIAMGYTTPEKVMAGWKASPGHNANLLNPNYTEFGAGYVDDTQDYWTQDFAWV